MGGYTAKSYSPSYTPVMNVIAESVSQTMEDTARSILIQANLPGSLWPFAPKHVVRVINRVSYATTKEAPYKILTGVRPSLKRAKVFGCLEYVLKIPRGSKFEARAVEGVYVETLEYGIFKVLISDEKNFTRVIESRHVTFDESQFPGAPHLVEYIHARREWTRSGFSK